MPRQAVASVWSHPGHWGPELPCVDQSRISGFKLLDPISEAASLSQTLDLLAVEFTIITCTVILSYSS